ncbi:MAG: succinate dehydrogenase assembly factor 2 [Methylophilaceae bacterium]
MMLLAHDKEMEQRRLAWRCRRGMLELDIVLQRFVAQQFSTLNLTELNTFDALLGLPDNDFWALISGSLVDIKNKNTRLVVTKIKEQQA